MSIPLKSSGWLECKRSGRACEACGRLDTYCTRTVDGERVNCRRVASKHPVEQRDGTTSWIHLVVDLGAPVFRSKAKPKDDKDLTPAQIDGLLKKFRQQLTDKRLSAFAKEMSVSEKSLLAFGAGYDADSGCLSAPMYDGAIIPIGIHLRAPRCSQLERDGYGKFAVKGGHNGLFIASDYSDAAIPEGITDDPSPLLLATPEGLSDCCAARDFGFRAIGRPSNNGGGGYLVDLLGRRGACKQDLVVMMEREATKWRPDGTPYWPGIEGPLLIMEKLILADVCHRVRYFIPPVDNGKDFREWATAKGNPIATVLIGVYDAEIALPSLGDLEVLNMERAGMGKKTFLTPHGYARGWLANERAKLEKRRVDERKEPTQ